MSCVWSFEGLVFVHNYNLVKMIYGLFEYYTSFFNTNCLKEISA